MWNIRIVDRVLHFTALQFILTVHFQTILTCVSEIVMIGIAEEKFYNHAAVFTTSLAKLGELSLWKQALFVLTMRRKNAVLTLRTTLSGTDFLIIVSYQVVKR